MSRYLDADTNLRRRVSKLIKTKFPNLKGVELKVVLDKKKKKSSGKIRLAEVKLADDMIKFLTKEQSENFLGYDYIMVIDNKLYEFMENKDLNRVIFHELCHCYVDEKGKYKVIPHDFEGFYAEIKYNDDDPEWKQRLAETLVDLYEEENED